MKINMGFFEDNFGENTNNESTPHRIKWEYKVEHNVPLQYVSVFAKLGNEGWETYMFRRIKIWKLKIKHY